jgi:hypothetical protein
MNTTQAIAMRDAAILQLEFARRYTLELLENTPHDRWLEAPPGAPTHLTWQVGHLAVAEYGLLMFRLRGRSEGDLELVPSWLRKNFGKGSSPAALTSPPSPEQLLEKLSLIHKRGLQEVRETPVEVLLEPTEMPYAGEPIKLGGLLFAPMHEMIHAGQIGLIRRLLGLAPIR